MINLSIQRENDSRVFECGHHQLSEWNQNEREREKDRKIRRQRKKEKKKKEMLLQVPLNWYSFKTAE